MSIQTIENEAQVFETVLQADGSRCPRPEVERRFKHLTPLSFNDAVAALVASGALVETADHLHVPIDHPRVLVEGLDAPVEHQHGLALERLAGVLSSDLVTSRLPVLSVEQLCALAERNPAVPKEYREVLLALTLLDYCGLATRENDGRWRPTRSALWAERLSF